MSYYELKILDFFQVDTLEKLLERGEKLDDLVERSNQLSSQAKLFYKVV